MRLIQVAVPVPQLDALTYSVPLELPDPVPGARVLVPLGKGTLTGIMVRAIAPGSVIRDPGSADSDLPNSNAPHSTSCNPNSTIGVPDPGSRTPDPDTIKPILDILDDTPFL